MGTTAQKLQNIINAKADIGAAITEKGGTVPEKISEYGDAIRSLPSGGGGSGDWKKVPCTVSGDAISWVEMYKAEGFYYIVGGLKSPVSFTPPVKIFHSFTIQPTNTEDMVPTALGNGPSLNCPGSMLILDQSSKSYVIPTNYSVWSSVSNYSVTLVAYLSKDMESGLYTDNGNFAFLIPIKSS